MHVGIQNVVEEKNAREKSKKKLNGLPQNNKNKTWTDKEMNLCAHVLANTDGL